ncbi:hypothetical protein LTR86_000955 [Recurvomyces mirabilis]|nr:hypothetical protein LTR86_000955 [Recurvomyces mirabilis]
MDETRLPTYEESNRLDDSSPCIASFDDYEIDSKKPKRFRIRIELNNSRLQHVTAVCSKLLPLVKGRVKSGLGKTTIVMLPSDDSARTRGILTGYEHEDLPLIVQLEGPADTIEFWRQNEALSMLQGQIFDALSGDEVQLPAPTVPEQVTAPPMRKGSSWFGRRRSQPAQSSLPRMTTIRSPVEVKVLLDHVYFRAETEYGLLETSESRAVIVKVNVSEQ